MIEYMKRHKLNTSSNPLFHVSHYFDHVKATHVDETSNKQIKIILLRLGFQFDCKSEELHSELPKSLFKMCTAGKGVSYI
jgi:hypothetical protein